MLLCIKRQFWHCLVTLPEIQKKKKNQKLKFNLKGKRAKIRGSGMESTAWEGWGAGRGDTQCSNN